MKTLAFVALAAVCAKAADDMGPAAFLWPPDRAWNPDADNTGPCGSDAPIVNRTDFPLVNGTIALVAQDDSYSTRVSISYADDPKFQSDFTTIIEPERLVEVDPGHTCIKVPDARAGTRVGDRATLQIIYTADFDRPENQTFYACADIVFVAERPAAMFGTCFNATDTEDVPAPTATGVPSVNPGHSDIPLPGTASDSGSGSSKLSGGAIAGIVIGSVVGVAAILGAAIWFYRERKQKNRLLRQRESWSLGKLAPGSATNDATSGDSIRLQNIKPAQGSGS